MSAAPTAGLIPDLPVIPGTVEQLIAQSGRVSATQYDPAPSETVPSSPYEQYAPQPQAQVTTPITTAPAAQPAAEWTPELEQSLVDVFSKGGLAPEHIEMIINGPEGLASAGLSEQEIADTIALYSSPDGLAQLQSERQLWDANQPTALDYTKALAPYAAGAVGVVGAGALAYNGGRHRLAARTDALALRYANGDQAAIAQANRGGLSNISGNRVRAMFDPAKAPTSQGRAGLQATLEHSGKLDPRTLAPGQTISPQVDDMLKAGTGPNTPLGRLAAEHGITPRTGENAHSVANRIAQRTGNGFNAMAAKAFEEGSTAKPFNSGGGGTFRPYDPNVATGPGWARYRAAADRAGIGLLHPKQHFRMTQAAFAAGPEMTAINAAKAQGANKLTQMGKGIQAGIAAKGTSGTVLGGMKGITTASLKSMTGKMGAVGVGIGAVLEAPKVYDTIKTNGIDSKEAGNAIGGATGRVAGGVVGFAAGSITSAAVAGAIAGSVVPGVGNVVGAVAGLVVGTGVAFVASDQMGKVGEKLGDGLSAAGKFADKVDAKLDATADDVKDVAHRIVPLPDKAVDYAVDGVKELTRTVTNPVGVAKDAAGAVVEGGKKLVNGIKGLFD